VTTWSSLRSRAVELDDRWDCMAESGYEADSSRALVEGCLHDLAHAIDIKPDRATFPTSGALFTIIQRMSPRRQDNNEIRALAIEVAFSQMAGLRLGARFICTFAAEEMNLPSNRVQSTLVRRVLAASRRRRAVENAIKLMKLFNLDPKKDVIS